jgi:hypothetical protein
MITLIIAFLILAKYPKSKRLQGQQEFYLCIITDHMSRFPAHEHVSGVSKIPTVIYYDRSGKVRAVGAEAMKEGIYEVAEDENWVKAEW